MRRISEAVIEILILRPNTFSSVRAPIYESHRQSCNEYLNKSWQYNACSSLARQASFSSCASLKIDVTCQNTCCLGCCLTHEQSL